ncbi:MAG: permease [Patescibacteria group bacterium]
MEWLISSVTKSFEMAFAMGWQILWALVLGFWLSAAIQAVVSKKQMTRLLPDDRTKSLAIATGLGAASSSCSYAAVALARSLFVKGANFTSAIAFEIASTNLVIELGIIMFLLLGWQFTLAEFVGGPIIIIVFAILARWFIRPKVIAAARRQAQKGMQGKMEAHAQMDMSVAGEQSLLAKLRSDKGKTAVSHYFVMDWQAVWKDIVLGLLIAGAAAALVPDSFWKAFFLSDNPTWAAIWGPIVGPLVAVISFVCSIGNVPLAAVLWNGGISFGGVISFIFADLIVVPIINIYRKYYGWQMAIKLTATLYLAMVLAGYVIEILFAMTGLIPDERSAKVISVSVSLNYTTILNLVFTIMATLLVWRFIKTGGRNMLRSMNTPHHEH